MQYTIMAIISVLITFPFLTMLNLSIQKCYNYNIACFFVLTRALFSMKTVESIIPVLALVSGLNLELFIK